MICFISISNPSYPQNQENKIVNKHMIKPNIFLIPDYGCNVIVIVGQEGLLIVDSGYKRFSMKLDSVISDISNLPRKYILNTHFHVDHVSGNKKISDGTADIIAHDNARKRMLSEWNVPDVQGRNVRVIPPYPEDFLADICLNDSLVLFFNNDNIQAIHFTDAHTDTDVVYYIRKANVMLAGDLFFSNGFPIIDIYYGGTIDGCMKAIDKILDICDSNTLIIPGHGMPSNRRGLVLYRNMLSESISRIHKLMEQGKTLKQVIDSDPLGDIYEGDSSWVPEDVFIHTVFNDLSGK